MLSSGRWPMLSEWSTKALLCELEQRGRARRLADLSGGVALEDYSRQLKETLPCEALAEVPCEGDPPPYKPSCAPVY